MWEHYANHIFGSTSPLWQSAPVPIISFDSTWIGGWKRASWKGMIQSWLSLFRDGISQSCGVLSPRAKVESSSSSMERTLVKMLHVLPGYRSVDLETWSLAFFHRRLIIYFLLISQFIYFFTWDMTSPWHIRTCAWKITSLLFRRFCCFLIQYELFEFFEFFDFNYLIEISVLSLFPLFFCFIEILFAVLHLRYFILDFYFCSFWQLMYFPSS